MGYVADYQQKLVSIGFPISVDNQDGPNTKRAVSWFQESWTRENLLVDGVCGPKTNAALSMCADQGGHLSDHFSMRESKSKGDGWPRFNRELVRGLEKLRSLKGRGLSPISVYRDPAHNKAVGGATNSEHLYGRACDISHTYGLTVAQVRSVAHFGGIGYRKSDGKVVHVDVRPGRSPANPALWTY